MTKYTQKYPPPLPKWEKWAKFQTKAQKYSKVDFVLDTGEQEIGALSGRLLDNPGELAYMYYH